MASRIVITEDGSSSIFIDELDEHYHSVHGALQESLHVFIEAGLKSKINIQSEISILEIGLGTGLNALLTCIEATSHRKKIYYTALEKFPLKKEIYNSLNYCNIIKNEHCSKIFTSIHLSAWGQPILISDFFELKKLESDIQDISFQQQFDIIYFDAFAPSAQPELWTSAIFKSMYHALVPNGILVTYCAKGSVKRTLKEVGFTIQTLPGPKGKREMTRAIK